MLSGYLALWNYPLVYELIRGYLPKECSAYSAAITLVVSVIIFYTVLFQIAGRLSPHCGNGYHLPRGKNIVTLALGGISGYFFSGLVGYAIALSPWHPEVAGSADFAGKAVHRLTVLTGIVDRFSLQFVSISQRRSQLLSRVTPWQRPESENKKEQRDSTSSASVIREAAPAAVQPPEKPQHPVVPAEKKAVKSHEKPKKTYDLSRYDSKPRKPAARQAESSAGKNAESGTL